MSTSPRPNILLIITDQQRYDSLGCTGNAHALTPHLDALAADGSLCHRFFTVNSVCMPARASLITGLYPANHGVWNNGIPLARRGYTPETPTEGGGLPRGITSAVSQLPTIADLFAHAGYRTASVGKLHFTPTQSHPSLGYHESRQRWIDRDPALDNWHGPYYGFQHVDLTIGHGENVEGHYRRWLDAHFPGMHDRVMHAQKHATRPCPTVPQAYEGALPIEAHPSTWCAQRASDYIRNAANTNDPFFLWVGFADPHHPFTPPAELARQFTSRDIAPSRCPLGDYPDKPASLRRFMRPDSGWHCPEDAVRLVRQYTDAMNHLVDRSVGHILQTLRDTNQYDNTIIVFMSDHGEYLGDFGLLFKTNHPAEPLGHVPLILRAPGHDLPPHLHNTLGTVDILPTLCTMADVPVPTHCHGQDLHSILTAGRRHPLMAQNFPADADYRSLTLYDDQHRYTWYPGTDEFELYDHAHDPCEHINRAHGNNEDPAAQTLHTALLEEYARTAYPQTGRIAVW